jgi:para-nitrobenzyl esterase
MANDIAAAEARLAPVVEIAAGKLRGTSSAGIFGFKGIPYGTSTTGRNRFMAPEPAQPWTGVRDALAYGGRAWQLPNRPKRRPVLETLLGPADTTTEGEDCLSLNVWTPGLGDGAKRPVMVWLHGGAFAYGSGNRVVTNGTNLARRGDVVVVSVNHASTFSVSASRRSRWPGVGAFRQCRVFDPSRHSVGYATISRLEADPANVSDLWRVGGGGKVSVLLAMPAARGLFHRAIIQSGAAIRVSTRERANALADAVLKEVGVGHTECERLQTVPAERLLAAIAPASRAVGRSRWPLLDRYDFGPVVDGTDLPQHPADPAAPAISEDIPLMIGGTREESAFFLADDDAVWNGTLTEAELRERLTAVAGSQTDALLAVYRSAMPQASPADRLIATLTGSNFGSARCCWRSATQPGAGPRSICTRTTGRARPMTVA